MLLCNMGRRGVCCPGCGRSEKEALVAGSGDGREWPWRAEILHLDDVPDSVLVECVCGGSFVVSGDNKVRPLA